MFTTVQIGIIIFLVAVLGLILQDECKRRIQSRKSARLNRFWPPGAERRKSVRIDTEIEVNYEVLSECPSKKRSSTSRNLSLGGINLALKEKLFPGTCINLRLNLPESSQSISTPGQIVWVRELLGKPPQLNEERLFAAGIKFTQLSSQQEAVLNNFIHQHLKAPKNSITKGAYMENLKLFLLTTVYCLLITVLIGCAEIKPPSPDEIMRQPLGQSALRIGMTKEEVKSIWGEPDVVRVIEADTQGMVKEEWIFRGRYPNLPINVDYLSENQHLFFDGDNLVRFEHQK